MKSTKKNDKISISLSNDEAIIFLNWLFHFNELENPSLFKDKAEKQILYELEAVLEKVIEETFDKDYNKIISLAWENVRNNKTSLS